MADRLIKKFGAPVRRQPSGFTAFLLGIGFVLGESYEIVIIGKRNAPDTLQMLQLIREANRPNTVVLQIDPDSDDLSELAPFTSYMKALNGKATVYVCQNFECQQPVTSTQDLNEILNSR